MERYTYKDDLAFENFVIVDLETTGCGRYDRVTEIGAVKVLNGKLAARFDTLVDPEVHIPALITEITGISNDMVAGAPTMEFALPSFLNFAEDLPLGAHNAPFDLRYLRRDAACFDLPLTNYVFDTLRLARRVWPGLETYKLTELTRRFQISQSSAHRAWCDAEATALLYLLMQSELE